MTLPNTNISETQERQHGVCIETMFSLYLIELMVPVDGSCHTLFYASNTLLVAIILVRFLR